MCPKSDYAFPKRVQFLEHAVYLSSVHVPVNTSKIVVVNDVTATVIWIYFMFDRSIYQFQGLSTADARFFGFQSDML
jgi:hypothetical protein